MGLPMIYTLISAAHVLSVRHSLMFLFALKLFKPMMLNTVSETSHVSVFTLLPFI